MHRFRILQLKNWVWIRQVKLDRAEFDLDFHQLEKIEFHQGCPRKEPAALQKYVYAPF
jgi:hypothetical protein